MDIDQFLNELENLLKEDGMKTGMFEGTEVQIGNTLRAMLPVTDDGDCVLLEVMAAPYSEDAHLLQIFSTILTDVGPKYEALLDRMQDWNLVCPLGAFGIYKQMMHLYHKYNYLIPVDVAPKEMAEEILYIIDLVQEAIMQVYPDAVRLMDKSQGAG